MYEDDCFSRTDEYDLTPQKDWLNEANCSIQNQIGVCDSVVTFLWDTNTDHGLVNNLINS